MKEIKTYVLDTNVILHDAEAIFKFDEHIVVIPQTVLEELDTKKREPGEIGYNARKFSRYVDELRIKGSLVQGVELNDVDGKLYITLFDQNVANCLPFQDMNVMDNRILATAKYLETYLGISNQGKREVIMVSKDTNMRIKADVFGIKSEDYRNDKISVDENYTGIQNLTIPQFLIDKVYEQGKLDASDLLTQVAQLVNDYPNPNECFVLHADSNLKQSALVRYNSVMKEFCLLPQDMKTVDIIPRNTEQQFALDLLKDDNINLVSMIGKAGSGKTLMALAAGLYGVLEMQSYNKILLLKPIVAMDNSHELGFLPGSMEEKLAPWMASYADNIELIMQHYIKDDDCASKKRKSKKEVEIYNEKQAAKINPIQELITLGLLEMGSLEHFRGRSLNNQFIILDEAQNCSKHAIKTIITRAGEGTKIILMGDVKQVDSPYLDEKSNGLSIVVELFKNQNIAGHITLKKSERSKLAEIASELFDPSSNPTKWD